MVVQVFILDRHRDIELNSNTSVEFQWTYSVVAANFSTDIENRKLTRR